MTKKLLILVIFGVILGSSLGGFFYWRKYIRETPPEEWDLAYISSIKSYTIKEIENANLVKNENEGLTIAIPKEWGTKENIQKPIGIFKVYSPGAIEKNVMIMEAGCRISIEIDHIKTNPQIVKENFKYSMWFPSAKKIELIKINQFEGARLVSESQELKFYHEEIAFPVKRKLYRFALDSPLKEKIECSREFINSLNTINIE